MLAVADGSISASVAAAELLRRRRARASLVDYSQAITIPGAPASDDADEWLFKPIETSVAAHHRVIMAEVEACIRADYGRLMIFAPPGSAKSTYASVVAPTWAMGAFPGLRVLMTSYAGTPITRASKKARQIVASPEYASLWLDQAHLVDGSKAADEWELTNGSGLYAAGLMGGLTSSRCDVGIIDDPVAGREEADSEPMRKKTLSAYQDDFLTRLKPRGSVILIQTRWHEDDLAGSLLPTDYDGRSGWVECRDGKRWRVLNLQACCERADDPLGRELGEYMWPEWFSPEHWAIYESQPRTWSALYQQRPTPDEGIYFKREWFKRHRVAPARVRYYLASDFATKKDDGDYTEHGVCGLDEDATLFLDGWFRDRVETDAGINAALDLAVDFKPLLWLGEKGPIESSIGPLVRRVMKERRTYVARELLPSVADKMARARAFMGLCSAGQVSVREGAWGDALIEQLIAFPAGRFDDGVDVCGLFGRSLDVMLAAKPAPQADAPTPEPFTDAWFAARDRRDATDEAARERYYR